MADNVLPLPPPAVEGCNLPVLRHFEIICESRKTVYIMEDVVHCFETASTVTARADRRAEKGAPSAEGLRRQGPGVVVSRPDSTRRRRRTEGVSGYSRPFFEV